MDTLAALTPALKSAALTAPAAVIVTTTGALAPTPSTPTLPTLCGAAKALGGAMMSAAPLGAWGEGLLM
eukprot:scaffold11252_cov21-Tisochrysis_lutea.AAC.1